MRYQIYGGRSGCIPRFEAAIHPHDIWGRWDYKEEAAQSFKPSYSMPPKNHPQVRRSVRQNPDDTSLCFTKESERNLRALVTNLREAKPKESNEMIKLRSLAMSRRSARRMRGSIEAQLHRAESQNIAPEMKVRYVPRIVKTSC